MTTVDCGLLLRAPHPRRPGRLVLIMAGPESLGTGTACLAATHSSCIEMVKAALFAKGIPLADKSIPFWVLLRGENGQDGMLDPKNVAVLECGGL